MRRRIGWFLLAGLLLALPATARAQYYEVPPTLFTGPLSHPRYEDGGFFMAIQALAIHQTNPMRDQIIAVRGFVDLDGSIGAAVGNPRGAGAFYGSQQPALSTGQVSGPGTYQPGFNLAAGWRFQEGTVLQVSWWHLFESRYSASATLAPPGQRGGAQLEDTFLFSDVFNFPINFAGNGQNVAFGNPGATFGIWNAASEESITFIQRYDHFDLTGRFPMWQSDSNRSYVLFGPRITWLFERFTWRVVDQDITGIATPDTTASFTNTVSQRFYGLHGGMGYEWFLGDTPIGSFSISLDSEVSLALDHVKLRAKYQLEDRSAASSRARNVFSLVPGIQSKISVWWYPWEAIQVQFGYEALTYFNTMAAPQPVDFNFGAVAPPWERGVLRLLHGFTLGAGFVF